MRVMLDMLSERLSSLQRREGEAERDGEEKVCGEYAASEDEDGEEGAERKDIEEPERTSSRL